MTGVVYRTPLGLWGVWPGPGVMEAESKAPEAWPGAEHRSPAGRQDTGLGAGVSEARDTGRWRFLELWDAQAGFPSPVHSERASL